MKQAFSARAQQILAAVISTYITTAEPVGSRTVSKLTGIGLSPASVRNVMADLEELGYLTRPHVSSGRVPTNKGLRFYVDTILEVRELDPAFKVQIQQALGSRPIQELDDLLRAASRALSGLSEQVALVAAPNPAQEIFHQIDFVLLHPGVILVVLVSQAGVVQNRIIQGEPELAQGDLNKYTRYLNELLADFTLNEVKARVAQEMTREKVRFDAVLSRALKLGERALVPEAGKTIFIEGQSNILQAPEFADISKLRLIFDAFEERSTLLRLLEKAMAARGVQILIGAENEAEELTGLTAVAASYGVENSPVGALGVIGPTRMDYSKVIPIVDYTARLVSRLLAERG